MLTGCSSADSLFWSEGDDRTYVFREKCPVFLEESEISEIYWYSHDDLDVSCNNYLEKNVLLYFSYSTCGPCIRFEEEILSHQAVIDTLSKFYITIKISDTINGKDELKELKEKYGVVGSPTLVILDSSTRQELIRTGGYYGNPGGVIEYLKFFCAYRR
jgi:thioredoxin-related protein